MIVLTMDGSPSMNDKDYFGMTKWQRANNAIREFINTL